MIVIFTRDIGRISAGTGMNEKGKGKSALSIRPFTYASYDLFSSRGAYNINGSTVKNSYYSIGENIDRFIFASEMMEYLNGILEDEQPKHALFDLTLSFLEAISHAESGFESMFFAYIVKTLRMMGFMPELSVCVDCGKSRVDMRKEDGHPPAFSVGDGGIICDSCMTATESGTAHKENGEKLIFTPNFDIVDVLKYFLDQPFEVFEKLVLKQKYSEEIREILRKYVQYYPGIELSYDKLGLD